LISGPDFACLPDRSQPLFIPSNKNDLTQGMKSFFITGSLLLFLVIPVWGSCADRPEDLTPITHLLLKNTKKTKHYPPDTTFTSIPTNTTVPLPDYLKTITGPVFQNRITRLSENRSVRVNYPKTPSWNSDGSLLMLPYRLLDGRTYATLASHTWWDDDERKWSALYPHIYYAMEHNYDVDHDGKNDHVFVKRDISQVLTGASDPARERLITFSANDYDEVLLGKYEGNIDHRDRYVVFAARKTGEKYLTAIVYDIRERNITTQKDMTTINWEDNEGHQVLDWISVSPSGRYILINWKKYPDHPSGEYRAVIDQFDIEMNFIRELAHQGQHGDIGVQANGRDMYVQFEFGGERRGIWGYDLESGQEIKLLPDKYNGGHISCRNTQRPGWCYPSTTAEGYREVFALKLDGSGTVNRFAQTHQTSGNSHGGVNADGTKIIFTSDWDNKTATDSQGNHAYEAFVVEVEQQ
jgi:hypothetical protein